MIFLGQLASTTHTALISDYFPGHTIISILQNFCIFPYHLFSYRELPQYSERQVISREIFNNFEQSFFVIELNRGR